MPSKSFAALLVVGGALIGWTAVVSLGIVNSPDVAGPWTVADSGGYPMHAPPPATGMRAAPAPAPAVEFELQPSEALPLSEAGTTAPPQDATQAAELELLRLRTRIRYLEARCALLPDGQIGRWASSVNPTRIPPQETLEAMAWALATYPVELQPEEGLWLAERFQLEDWYAWGPSVDGAIIMMLGPARIAAACSPEQLEALRENWADEGYFAP